MALFPAAKFSVLLAPPGYIVPGTRVEGTLTVQVPSDIPRAQRLDLCFRSTASATYGGGQDATTESKDIFVAPFRVAMDPSRLLAAGAYSYPFSFDVPAWLPVALEETGHGIRHRIEVRLDVDWAVDPTKEFTPLVVMTPIDTVTEPLVVRSPRGWHSSLVVDVTLDRAALAVGESVTGELALRGGHDTRFDAIEVALQSQATIVMGKRDRRYGRMRKLLIPADRLRAGESVRFRLEYPRGAPPTFRTGFIDHDLIVAVHTKGEWLGRPGFELKVHALPEGSTVRGPGDARPVALGLERLMNIAKAMAEASGFERGRLPVLVEGKSGPIRVRMTDGPRGGRIGVDVDYGLPDLDLGIVFRPIGTLELSRESPLLPRKFARRSHVLRVESDKAESGPLAIPVPEEALKRFFAALLEDLEDPSNEVRLSDHHFGFHLVLRADNVNEMVTSTKWTKARAEVIASAIGALPFAAIHPDAETAWIATAQEQHGFLVPHIPAIHGLVVSTPTLGGELRVMGVTLRTKHDRTIAADLDLRLAPLPVVALAPLEQGTEEKLAPVRAVFPRCRPHSLEKITLEGATFTPDPRPLLSVLDVFLDWLLDQRGERRTQSAYR